jgi:hypothetical protein
LGACSVELREYRNSDPLSTVLRPLWKILIVKNATKQRNLGTLTYKMKCKWENQGKKELRLEKERELDGT